MTHADGDGDALPAHPRSIARKAKESTSRYVEAFQVHDTNLCKFARRALTNVPTELAVFAAGTGANRGVRQCGGCARCQG